MHVEGCGGGAGAVDVDYRWGDPAELGPAVVFLASDAAAYITGTTLTIDGGYTAR